MSIMRPSMASLPPLISRVASKVSSGQKAMWFAPRLGIPLYSSWPRSTISLKNGFMRSPLSKRAGFPLNEPQELLGSRLLRRLENLARRPLLDDDTAVHEDDTVRHL